MWAARLLAATALLLGTVTGRLTNADPSAHGGTPDGGPRLEAAPSPDLAGELRTWRGSPRWVPGEWTFDRGEVIVTDHPFDDRGPDLDGDGARPLRLEESDPSLAGTRSAMGSYGDYRYPTDRGYVENETDIAEVRVAADAHAWHLLVVLNSLLNPERIAVEARIGHRVLLAHGSSASLDGTEVDVHADAERNVFEMRVPRSVYDPGNETAPMFVATGLWDPDAGDWYRPMQLPGVAPYFDLAYVPEEGMDSYWRERIQSRHIAEGTFDEDHFPVDFGRLVNDPCNRALCPDIVPHRGLHTRVFRSAQTLGEGLVAQERYGGDLIGWKLYRSPYQPYALYQPFSDPAKPRPLVLLLHGAGGNHMSNILSSGPKVDELQLSHLVEWADQLEVVVAMPLARGEGGWYEGEAEKDVFEVWRDVARHVNIDRDRVYVAGVGMGGFGAYRLAHLYPDQFAAAIALAAPVTPASVWPAPLPATAPGSHPPACERDDPECGYSLIELFGNAANVPHLILHGGLDPIVPASGPETWTAELGERGTAYRYVLYPARGHETAYAGTSGNWLIRFLGDHPARQRSPTRVSYSVLRDLFDEERGLIYDRAYWISGIVLADDASFGRIEGQRSNPTATPVPTGVGRDELGPYVLRGQDLGIAAPVGNHLALEATGIAAAVIDVSRAGLVATSGLSLAIHTDADLWLTLDGDFPPATTVVGANFEWAEGSVVLYVPAGDTSVIINP